MRRSRRSRLRTDDIDRALALHGRSTYLTPTYALKRASKRASKEEKTAEGGSQSGSVGKVEMKGVEDRLKSRSINLFQPLAGMSEANKIYFVQNETVNLSNLIKLGERRLPKVPTKPFYKTHWLAIDGIQPSIPENPLYDADIEQTDSLSVSKKGDNRVSKPAQGNGDADEISEEMMKLNLPEELSVYFAKVTTTISTYRRLSLSPSLSQPTFRHNINIEAEIILHSLQVDPNLKPLLPFLIRFACQQIRGCLQPKKAVLEDAASDRVGQLFGALRLIRSLLLNRCFSAENFMTEILSHILSCLVNKSLGRQSPTGPPDKAAQLHWSVRDYASKIIRLICDRYKFVDLDIQPRILRSLTTELTSSVRKNLHHMTDLEKLYRKGVLRLQYGILVALTSMRQLVIQTYVLPQAVYFLETYRKAMTVKTSSSRLDASWHQRKEEPLRCYSAVLTSVGKLWTPLRASTPAMPAPKKDDNPTRNKTVFTDMLLVESVLGEELLPFSASYVKHYMEGLNVASAVESACSVRLQPLDVFI